MRSEAQKKADARYKEKLKNQGIKSGRSFILYCYDESDADVIKILESKANKSGYLKELVRKDK